MKDTAATVRTYRLDRAQREEIVLNVAARLFYARGVHEVGMDELVRETGLGKATVYRLFASKDVLIAAYLTRLANTILEQIDADANQPDVAQALHSFVTAIDADLSRPGFRGCAFNNASIEYDDPGHPARVAARTYRSNLHSRLIDLCLRLLPGQTQAAQALGGQLAVLVDGAYTNAAHLGPGGPAAAGLALAHSLIDTAATPKRVRR